MMFTIENRSYTLKYTIGRLEALEKATGRGAMDIWLEVAQNRMPKLTELKLWIAEALDDENGRKVPHQRALTLAETLLTEHGLSAVCVAIVEQLQEDCGFLFRAG